MPTIPINYLAVLVATVVGMAIGFLWYGPLFGKKWMKLMGISREKMETMKKKGMGKTIALNALATLIMSFVLDHSLIFASSYLGVNGWMAGVQAGFWNWLGFIAPVTLSAVLWEGRSWKLWILNNGHYLVALVAMGVVLAVM